MKTIKRFKGFAGKIKALFMVGFISGTNMVHAALPDVADPTNPGADGNYVATAQGWAHDIIVMVGLVLGALAFTVVAKNIIATYSEIGAGKKTWGDMGMQGGMGVLLLVFVIFMVTEASTVIFA